MAGRGQGLVPVQGGGLVGAHVIGPRPAAIQGGGGVRQPRAPRQPRVQGAVPGRLIGSGTAVNEVTMKHVQKNVVETTHEEYWIDGQNKKRKSIDRTKDDTSIVQSRKLKRTLTKP